jgi:hypothetical protein
MSSVVAGREQAEVFRRLAFGAGACQSTRSSLGSCPIIAWAVTAAGVRLGSIYCASGACRIFRKVESGKMPHQIGRSLIWQLAQTRPILESEALERIEEKLEQLGGGKVTRIFGDEGDDRPPLISH